MLQIRYNTSNLLTKNVDYVHAYAHVYKIEHSYYYKKSQIYLNDIYTNNKVKIPSNINVKLTYFGETNLKEGDIISFSSRMFAIQHYIKPYGYNYINNAYYHHIGATGYIIGVLSVIFSPEESSNSIFYYTREFKNYLANKILFDLKNDRIASYLVATTLGASFQLPKEEVNNLQNSSLSHLIAISGFQVSVISLFLFFLIRKFLSIFPTIALNYNTKKIAAVLSMIFLIAYAMILEDNEPAIRSIIMTMFLLFAMLINCKSLSLNSIYLAACILISFNLFSIFSVSFLLSFFATLSIIMLMNFNITKSFHKKIIKRNLIYKLFANVILSLILTFCVEITILPILSFYFSNIPTVGILCNLLAEPLFTFIVMPCMMIYFSTPNFIATIFLNFAAWGMSGILWIAKYFGSIHHSTINMLFFPNYCLVIILISVLLFSIINYKIKSKFKYLLLLTIPFCISYYIFLFEKPALIVSPNFKSITFLIKDHIYNGGKLNSFLQSVWFNNNVIINDITNNPIFICNESTCLTIIQNHKIVFSLTTKKLKGSITINNINDKFEIALDSTFMSNHYAFIYLNKNNHINIKYLDT